MEEEEDVHVCLRCSATIQGLDKYVEHRRNGQCNPENLKSESERTDDFMQSLGLVTQQSPQEHQQHQSSSRSLLLPFSRVSHPLELDDDLVQCLRPLAMSPMMQTDFLRQMDLVNVAGIGLDDEEEDAKMNQSHAQNVLNFDHSQDLEQNDHFDDEQTNEKANTTNNCSSDLLVTAESGQAMDSGAQVWSEANGLRSCEGCGSWVRISQFGKHLISHYHHHKTRNSQISQQLVLENIEPIVRLAPFQCSLCHFYTNWQTDFLDHWKSKEHMSRSEENDDDHCFWCDFCQVYEQNSDDMLTHLESARHNEIVEALGRHVPLVIRCVQLFKCEECGKLFRLRVALQRHLQRHRNCGVLNTVNKNVEDKIDTNESSQETRNSNEYILKNEIFDEGHVCGVCGLLFVSAQHLGAHVKRGCIHGATNDKNKKSDSNGDSMFKCDSCHFECKTASMLLFHRSLVHQSDASNYTCVACFASFGLKSRLWTHVLTHVIGAAKCDQCYKKFASYKQLQAHLLKCGPVLNSSQNNAVVRNSRSVLKCSQCAYTTTKARLLKLHVRRRHEIGWNFSQYCSKCDMHFSSPSTLQRHRRLIHDQVEHLRPYKCSECGYSGRTASDLKSHMRRHSEKHDFLRCSKCDFSCQRRSELTRHQRLRHGDSKQLQCGFCGYRTTSNQHLGRHVAAVHDVKKQLKCPMCDYKTGSIDNLRKHVLNTKRHADKPFLYDCRHCSEQQFVCNETNRFQAHLADNHAQCFENAAHIVDYVKNFFVVD